jgi:hypothetical protein
MPFGTRGRQACRWAGIDGLGRLHASVILAPARPLAARRRFVLHEATFEKFQGGMPWRD